MFLSILDILSSFRKYVILWFPLFMQKLIPIAYFVFRKTSSKKKHRLFSIKLTSVKNVFY